MTFFLIESNISSVNSQASNQIKAPPQSKQYLNLVDESWYNNWTHWDDGMTILIILFLVEEKTSKLEVLCFDVF